MQKITITGYLSRDAEQANTLRGDAVTRWNVPVRQGFGDKEQTNWYRVSIWGKRAQFAAKARKGDFVCVDGDLTIGEYQGKAQYDIRAHDFSCVSSAPREEAPRPTGGGAFPQGDDLDDSIPFATNTGMW